jgi:hypothetical protein
VVGKLVVVHKPRGSLKGRPIGVRIAEGRFRRKVTLAGGVRAELLECGCLAAEDGWIPCDKHRGYDAIAYVRKEGAEAAWEPLWRV